MTAPAVPDLSPDVDRLGASVRRRYRATWRWLLAAYDGPWTGRTEPLQAFMHRTFPPPDGPRSVRARTLRALLNRYVHPPLHGPSITMSGGVAEYLATLDRGRRRRLGTSSKKQDDDAGAPTAVLRQYIPRALQEDITADRVWMELLACYVTSLGANPLRRNQVRTYVTHVLRVLRGATGASEATRACLCRSAEDFLRLDAQELAQAVADTTGARLGQRRICRIAVNRFIGEVAFRGRPGLASRLHLRMRDLPQPMMTHEPAREEDAHPADVARRTAGTVRDHFTAAEMAALLAQPGLSLRDRLILHVMSETGLRRRAVSWLQVESVYDRAAGAPLPVCTATEKGLVARHFVLSDATRALLAGYLRDGHPCPASCRWLFPCPTNPAHPICAMTVNAVLLRACHRIGVSGQHVHTHGIRKYVCCQLMSHRNTIEHVAKFLGHRNINTTFGTYWDATTTELSADMNIPWLQGVAVAEEQQEQPTTAA